MWCDQAESVGSRTYWFWDTAKQRDQYSYFPNLFAAPLIAHISWTKCPISIGFSAKCGFANSSWNQVEKID